MNIYPAIDLRDGKVVRLYQGDYDQMTVYQEDPVDVARNFKAAGADYLHLVDLDGAKDGELVNFDTIKAIVEDVDMFVEVGGGIRDEERIKQYLDLGVGRVILGTIAVKDREFLEKMVSVYGERIAVGVDARDDRVAINGWKEITDIDSFEFCEYLRDIGVKAVIYTDISRDGGLQGTNMEVYRKLQEIQGLEITASGGISFIEEIAELKNVTAAAILGKALYSGLIDLAQAVEMAK
ncbi:MAG: 1-(5-phosphoribosyl)-5-[(5-phosphoribosylamino)methylideneamino]imidazole-4-carboxamide isomerase [Clostridiales bacterium]|nr:1-(5-phosphoribosyl)-5-[(5-phosphoribosylamino)methylideneamino]imidazole-4-carboxamide isomerase [Clostridiales bacterium]